ncbi:MAG: immunity 50 family protein [Planctomycetaceae bacterium]|jgi:hypothetical protein|nr:immunity 50 family protein [Planctomycetaceae bacterium]
MNTNTNNNWIDLIENKQAINSLYKKPPSLERITIKTIDFGVWSPEIIYIGFITDQMPDIIPKRGLWRSCPKTDSVFISLHFGCVQNFSVDNFDLSHNCSLEICVNPEFVYETIPVGKMLALKRTDRLQIKLSTTSSQLSFFVFNITVDSIRPVNHENDFRKK